MASPLFFKQAVKGLCSSVIYGPNAAGKTNIIGAMDVFRAIVLKGDIRNSEEQSAPNPALAALELIPNNQTVSPEPVYFSVEFYEEDSSETVRKFKIRYELKIDLGTFLDAQYSRKIVQEALIVNGETVFCRTDKLLIENLKVIRDYLSDAARKRNDSLKEIAKNSLDTGYSNFTFDL